MKNEQVQPLGQMEPEVVHCQTSLYLLQSHEVTCRGSAVVLRPASCFSYEYRRKEVRHTIMWDAGRKTTALPRDVISPSRNGAMKIVNTLLLEG